jgi:hypothetical protein
MEPTESREGELQHCLSVLQQMLKDGKVTFASHLAGDVRRSLAAVRYGSDGQVDLSTVDGRVRSLAWAAAKSGIEALARRLAFCVEQKAARLATNP